MESSLPARGQGAAATRQPALGTARLSALTDSRGQSPSALEAQIAGILQKAAHRYKQLAERAVGPMAQGPQKLVDQIVPKQVQHVIPMLRSPQQAAAKVALDVAERMLLGEHDRDR